MRLAMSHSFLARIEEAKQLLRFHPVYAAIRNSESLRIFMERHVLCVWDFMSLLKSLQTSLSCTAVPWLPPPFPEAARFVNEMVLREESDEIRPGLHRSHFEWYLEAMREAGCASDAIDRLVGRLAGGAALRDALQESGLPSESLRSTRHTLDITRRPLAVKAAVFFHGREDVTARMFLPIVGTLEQNGLYCPTLLAYLRRHVEMDSKRHGPMAARLMEQLFAVAPQHRDEAHEAVWRVLDARRQLWDATLRRIQHAESARRRSHRGRVPKQRGLTRRH